VNLIDNFTTGFKDLVNKPIQGIKISAKEGVVGLYKGVVSFTTHTIGGTLNTTSKITDGLSKGMLMLSQDDKYIQERETKKICERPNNVLEGCAYGLNSLSNGVYEGVKGLITKPVEGIKENDLAGLGKGIVQGIGGFFFKPISGVFDFVSKTTEGIKMSFKSDNVNIKRLRSSRPFYRKNKIIKNINLIDIQNIEYLQKFIKNKKINIDFYNSISYLNRHNNEIIIIFLNTGIFVIDKNIDEELLELKYEYIKEIVNENTKIKIFFKKKINNKFYVKIEITNNNENPVLLTKKIISKFQNSITMYNEEKNII
jgi:vacuolar protein sorting-associated protein 13A/C